LLVKGEKNLTAEVAEHAEIKATKGSRTRGKGKTAPFQSLPENLKLPRGVHRRDSALSASSSVILLSSSAEDLEKEIS
jgi:hypothetical protein